MSLLARFEKQLELRGLSVKYHGDGRFTLCGPEQEKTPEIMASCKAMKKVLLGKYDPKFIPAEANNPANTLHPQKPPPPPTVCESSTTGATQTTETPSVCAVCLSEVDPEEMRTLPPGMWMEMCGRGMGQKNGEPCCPYRPKSLWSNPHG